MNREPYNLRHRNTVEEKSSGGEEFYETKSFEIENLLAQMQSLQQEVNVLRQSDGILNDLTKPNLQKVHIHKFNKHNPHLWFARILRLFVLNNVTSDSNKFDVISVHHEDNTLLSIEDLITDLPRDHKFSTLKERLSKFAESSEPKLRRVLQGGETLGRKPSEILADMRRLALGKGNEAIIRTIF